MTTPPTPAMTAQEALATLIGMAEHEENARDGLGNLQYSGMCRNVKAVLETALFDAERRVTEAETWQRTQIARANAEERRAVAAEAANGTVMDTLMQAQSRLSAVEARCAKMREALEFYANEDSWSDEGGVHDDYTSAAKRDRGARARSILAYPGGKSDQGEKEKPTISSGPVPETMVDAAFKAAAGRMSRKQTRHVLRQAHAGYPPAGGEGKPEPVAWEVYDEASGRWLRIDDRNEAVQAAEKRGVLIHPIYDAPVAPVRETTPLSRSGDSALVEAVALLTEVSNGVPGRENELLAEIDKFIQQHGERK